MMPLSRILMTEDDMASLRELVRRGRAVSSRDQDHLEELDRELDRAEVVSAENLSPDVVTMQSTVRVRDIDSGTRVVYTIVYPVDADIDRKRISILAPIGTALIGYRAGDVIEWATPGGTRRLQIEKVLFQPEAAGGADIAPRQHAVHDMAMGAAAQGRGPVRSHEWPLVRL
jgi:regulator of nucleoside diphosphate kinase